MPEHRAPRSRSRPRSRPRSGDLAGVGSVVALACAYLSPALKDGAHFGSFDRVIPITPLGAGTYRLPAFNRVNTDSVSQMNVWNGIDWHAIHSGHFPLWNGLSLLGLPHFLNFESAVLSLPDVVSYAVPLTYAFFVTVLVKLLIAGTGAYVLARVLGLRPFAASFAGVTFMLSGAFANWLAWPLADVVAWLGWIAAFGVLAFTRPDRLRYVAGLAVAVAFCGYGGFPEANVFVALALAVMAAVVALWTPVWRRSVRSGAVTAAGGAAAVLRFDEAGLVQGSPGGPEPSLVSGARGVLAGAGRVAAGAAAGVLLAMPLWYPGLQILSIAHRATERHFAALPARSLSLLLAQGYYGLPTGKNPFFLTGWNYYESVAYVGVVVIVLAIVAIVAWWRHPTVVALAACCVVVLLVSYEIYGFHPLGRLLNDVTTQVQWQRFRSVLGLPLGLLGGLGLETLGEGRSRPGRYALRSRRAGARGSVGARGAHVALGAGTLLAAAALGLMASQPVSGKHASVVRGGSLVWPFATLGVLVAATVALSCARAARRDASVLAISLRAGASAALWGANAAFLLFAGVGVNGYSQTYFPSTPAIAALRHHVGSSLVGLDDNLPSGVQLFVPVGFYPEANAPYGIAQFTGHDPVLPQGYFQAFAPAEAEGGPGFFEPDITTVAEARRYGIAYVLAAPGARPIAGARQVADIAGERLYAIPGAARVSLEPASGASGRIVRVSRPSGTEWDVVTTATGRSRLVVRVTAVPGWHATIDGRPVALDRTDHVMWSLAVPPGRHRIRVWYLPGRIFGGLAMAGAGVLLLAATCGGGWRWRRRMRRDERDGPAGTGAARAPRAARAMA